jgi:hypothetical protein
VIYAFTGPTELTPEQSESVLRIVRDLRPMPEEIRTGGAKGWDVLVAEEAVKEWPGAHHVLCLPDAPFDEKGVRRVVDLALQKRVRKLSVIFCPRCVDLAGTYRSRNNALICGRDSVLPRCSDTLVAGVFHEKFYRSGEWMTINIAARAGCEIRRVVLS